MPTPGATGNARFSPSGFVLEQAVVVRTLDDPTGVVTVQAPAPALGEIDDHFGVLLQLLLDPGHQLLVGVAHEHTAETGGQGIDVVATVSAEDHLIPGDTECLHDVFEGGLLRRAVG